MTLCQRHQMTPREIEIFIGPVLVKNPPQDLCGVCAVERTHCPGREIELTFRVTKSLRGSVKGRSKGRA